MSKSKLEDFTPTVNPDNRDKYINCDNTDEIVIGGTCKHTFNLAFKFSEYAKAFEIFYKQGLSVVLTKTDGETTMEETEKGTLVKVVLSPDDTKAFTSSFLDTQVQIKIINKNDEIFYTEPYRIIVSKPLEY